MTSHETRSHPLRLPHCASSRRAARAIVGTVFLGVAITLIHLLRLDKDFYDASRGTGSFGNTTSAPDFFRLWKPPWSRNEADGPATVFAWGTRTCRRTLLFRFAGSHGFASEYLIFLRVALLAKRFDYELIIDDSHWNYGRWTDYFTPRRLPCSPPYAVKNADRVPLAPVAGDPPLALVRLGGMQPSWTQASHVVWSVRKLDYLDQMLLDLYTNASEVEALHRQDRNLASATSGLTDLSETLPAAYRDIFDIMSNEVAQLWDLNREMRSVVDATLSPFSLGSVDSAPIIAAHVRLGDKSLEIHKFGPAALPKPRKSLQQLYEIWYRRLGLPGSGIPSTRSMRRSDLPLLPADPSEFHSRAPSRQQGESRKRGGPVKGAYVTAALILADSLAIGAAEKTSSTKSKPILLVISDDIVGEQLRDMLQHTGIASLRLFLGLDALAKNESTAIKETKHDVEDLMLNPTSQSVPEHGFYEDAFNAMPLSERVANTRTFIRDLTAVSRLADGLVFTGSSNVGRLLALLNAQGRNQKKNFRSVDVRWFPTARYQ